MPIRVRILVILNYSRENGYILPYASNHLRAISRKFHLLPSLSDWFKSISKRGLSRFVAIGAELIGKERTVRAVLPVPGAV